LYSPLIENPQKSTPSDGADLQNIVELTQLPMMDRARGVKLVIGIAEGFAEALLQSDCGSQGVLFESLKSEHFFDISVELPA
jgi:hypothetical protein